MSLTFTKSTHGKDGPVFEGHQYLCDKVSVCHCLHIIIYYVVLVSLQVDILLREFITGFNKGLGLPNLHSGMFVIYVIP